MKCNNCGCECSEDALFCKKCGAKIVPFSEKVADNAPLGNSAPEHVIEQTEKKRSSLPLMVGGVSALIIALGVWLFFFISNNKTDDVAKIAPSESVEKVGKNETTELPAASNNEVQQDAEADKAQDASSVYVDFYNSNYSTQKAVPLFVNMDEDDDLELIVISIKETPTKNENLIYEDTLLEVFDKQGSTMEKVFSDSDHERYSIIVTEDGSIGLIYSTLPNYIYDFEGEEQFYHVSLSHGEAEEINIPESKYRELLPGAISLNESGKAFKSTRLEEKNLSDITLYNYSTSMIAKLVAKAKSDGEVINDAMFVSDKNGLVLYATLGPSQADVKRQGYEDDYYLDSYARVICLDDKLNEADLGEITLANVNDEYGDDDLTIEGYGIYKFDDICQYYVDVSGVEFETQYKYGNIDGKQQLIDSELEFYQNENGIYCCSYREWGEGYLATEYVEVTFVDGLYKQYGSSIVTEADMESIASNWNDITNICTEEIYTMDYLATDPFAGEGIIVNDVALEDIRKGTNGKYYITFSFSATNSYEESIKYDGHVYYTYRSEGTTLVRENIINYIDKLEASELDLPVLE